MKKDVLFYQGRSGGGTRENDNWRGEVQKQIFFRRHPLWTAPNEKQENNRKSPGRLCFLCLPLTQLQGRKKKAFAFLGIKTLSWLLFERKYYQGGHYRITYWSKPHVELSLKTLSTKAFVIDNQVSSNLSLAFSSLACLSETSQLSQKL